MKVIVSFDDAKVVVPCGDGSNTIEYLIAEAFSRYKKVVLSKNKDINHLNIDDLELNLKDGGILDPDDKIIDVVEDKEQILATFRNGISYRPNLHQKGEGQKILPLNLIDQSIDLRSALEDGNSCRESVSDDCFCTITAEDLLSGSHLRVRHSSEPSLNFQDDSSALGTGSLEVSKNLSRGKSLEQLRGESPLASKIKDGNQASDIRPETLEFITLTNNSPILGIHVMPEYNTKQGLTGLRVRNIEKDGLADKDGRLKCGDVIVEINNISLYKVDFTEAQEIFKCARSEPELHLKVIHKDADPSLVESEKPRQSQGRVGRESGNFLIESSAQIQQRKDYASMTNLSRASKDEKDVMKSASMSNLLDESEGYHLPGDKSRTKVVDDEGNRVALVNGNGLLYKQFEKEAYGHKRFYRKNAYDSLNRAVDKSIDPSSVATPDVKEDALQSDKPSPPKKQHWWSRLRLNKSDKVKSDQKMKKGAKDEVQQTGHEVVATNKFQAQTSANADRNNNSSVKDDKSMIEWMHRVSWLDSTSDSLVSRKTPPLQVVAGIPSSSSKLKINKKGDNSEHVKSRSKSSARSEKLPVGKGDSQFRLEHQESPKYLQMHSKSFTDLSVLGNHESLEHSRHEADHHHNRDIDRHFNPPNNLHSHEASRFKPVPSSNSNFPVQSSPPIRHYRPHLAHDLLFGHDASDHHNKRLSNVLKEKSSHDRTDVTDRRSRYSTEIMNFDALGSSGDYTKVAAGRDFFPGPPVHQREHHRHHVSTQNYNVGSPILKSDRNGYMINGGPHIDRKKIERVPPVANFNQKPHASCLPTTMADEIYAGQWRPDRTQQRLSPRSRNVNYPHHSRHPNNPPPPPPIAEHFLPQRNHFHQSNVADGRRHAGSPHWQPIIHSGTSQQIQQFPYRDSPNNHLIHHIQQNSDITDYIRFRPSAAARHENANANRRH